MTQPSEWSRPSVNDGACGYATLNKYYAGSSGMSVPDPSASARSQRMILPSFSPPPGYNSVSGSQRVPSCNGYFNVDKAYGGNCGCAGDYTAKLCQS